MHTYTENELHDLWQRLRQGDVQAFAALMTSQYNAMYKYAVKFSPESDIIRDGIQDLFLDLWEKRATLSDPKSIKPYLFLALRNKILKTIVHQNRIVNLDNILFDFKDPDFNIEQKHIADQTDTDKSCRLQKLMTQLTDRQREILYLRFNQNLNNEAIADIMGVNKQSVANLLYRTLVELKEKWVGSLTSLIFTLFTYQIFF
jgi:RNA polymerase sigma factor (sigma-70 family)